MKNLILFTFGILICCLIMSCSSQKRLAPHFKEYHKDPFGSYIEITKARQTAHPRFITGELISLEKDSIYILSSVPVKKGNYFNDKTKLTAVAVRDVYKYEVFFASVRSKNAYLISLACTLAHGFFLFITVPINIVAISIIEDGEASFYSVRGKNTEIDNLTKFCRFPQGMPDDVREMKLSLRVIEK